MGFEYQQKIKKPVVITKCETGSNVKTLSPFTDIIDLCLEAYASCRTLHTIVTRKEW